MNPNTTAISAALLVNGRVIFATRYDDGQWRTLGGVIVPLTTDTLAVSQRYVHNKLHRYGGRQNGAVIINPSMKLVHAIQKNGMPVDEYVAFRQAREEQ